MPIIWLFYFSIEEILASSDESENEEKPKERKVSGKKNKGQMYIKEDDDDIVDLVSPAAASKLSGTLHLQNFNSSLFIKKLYSKEAYNSVTYRNEEERTYV